MGSHDYGPEIDIWSAGTNITAHLCTLCIFYNSNTQKGCILVELLTNDYLFAGSNESDQLNMIFKVFGTPNESVWPGNTLSPLIVLVLPAPRLSRTFSLD